MLSYRRNLFSLISEVMKQNLTTLGSTHHFLQGIAQVSAAHQPFQGLGLSHSFVEYKGSLWKFFLGTRSSSQAPRLEFVFVGRLGTGSIPFPLLQSHETGSLSCSLRSESSQSSQLTLNPRLHQRNSLSSFYLFSPLHLFLYSASIPSSCCPPWGTTLTSLPHVFLILAGLKSRHFLRRKSTEQ